MERDWGWKLGLVVWFYSATRTLSWVKVVKLSHPLPMRDTLLLQRDCYVRDCYKREKCAEPIFSLGSYTIFNLWFGLWLNYVTWTFNKLLNDSEFRPFQYHNTYKIPLKAFLSKKKFCLSYFSVVDIFAWLPGLKFKQS